MSFTILDNIVENDTFLGLDLSLRNTGYCVSDLNRKSNEIKIIETGTIKTDSGDQTDCRIRFIIDKLKKICLVYNLHCVCIEQPPDTIYNQRLLSKNQLAGKAVNIFKLRDSYGSVISFCILKRINYVTIQPSQWQPSKKKRKNIGVKQWSIDNANRISKRLCYNKLFKNKDEHEADALNIVISHINKIT